MSRAEQYDRLTDVFLEREQQALSRETPQTKTAFRNESSKTSGRSND
jgi:hypothetical protein